MVARILGVVVGAVLARRGSSELMTGMSYGPTPVRTPEEASRLPQDDYFCDEAAPMWSSAGRGDLKMMRFMGANTVRLYGNDPRNSHDKFLGEADDLGLQVLPGMSDWPYYQKNPGNCREGTDFNCFTQVRPLYLDNLRKGFLTAEGKYHRSLRVMNVLNEPDLKMPPTATIGGADGPVKMARALISAFDAMLDAEKEMGVTGPLINFTATFSYAICMACSRFKSNPALGQMAVLDDAMRNPAQYGYTPKNDITDAYNKRWTHSFNTQNPATDLQHQFLDDYNVAFPNTPVYIGEYHRAKASQVQDLSTILAVANRNVLFVGICFFEFTVSYYKTGTETEFGAFGYGSTKVASMDYFGMKLDVPCLEPVYEGFASSMPEEIAKVYGGVVDSSLICGPGTGSTTAADRTSTSQASTSRFLEPTATTAEGATTSPSSGGATTTEQSDDVDTGVKSSAPRSTQGPVFDLPMSSASGRLCLSVAVLLMAVGFEL